MNSLQKLCVVCSKCNECAMEVECLKYCDPSIVLADSGAFRRNAAVVVYLYRTLYPALARQNAYRTSTLTLYMQILIKSLYEDVVKIDGALEEFSCRRDRDAYYRRVLDLDRCARHDTVEILITEKVRLSVPLATLNDVERLICKLNCVYGTLHPRAGLRTCRRLMRLLGLLCGVSPVASPEVFTETTNCLQCYEELCVVPNQGRSIARRLQGLLCDHITVRKSLVSLETDIQTTEQDISEAMAPSPRICGIISAIRNLSSFSPVSHSYISEAEEALRGYNLFTDIPDKIYSLSDFTYWSKTSEVIVKHVGVTLRQLNLYHGLYKALRNEVSLYMYGEEVEDVFSMAEDRFLEDERLFAGSVFAAPGKVVDLITSMSIKSFEENPIFNKLHESNEVYTKIRSLIDEIRRPEDRQAAASGGTAASSSRRGAAAAATGQAGRQPPPAHSSHRRSPSPPSRQQALTAGAAGSSREAAAVAAGGSGTKRTWSGAALQSTGGAAGGAGRDAAAGDGAAGADEGRRFLEALEVGDPLVRAHDIHREVNVRKRAYLQKVSEVGYNKVMKCIKNQEHLIQKLVNANLVGTVCLEALSKTMNGFLLREGFLDGAGVRDIDELLTYDDHLYVVNNLMRKTLPSESLPELGQRVYRLVNGPLFTHENDYYPLPHNVDMAYACDNAGVLPHMKDNLVRCAEGTVQPSEWIVTRYKRFFSFSEAADLNAVQKSFWESVRELVLSVALYNEVFDRQLVIHRADSAPTDAADGLILTYNPEAPLVLRVGEGRWRSKDLYLALYQHLNVTGAVPPAGGRSPSASPPPDEPGTVDGPGLAKRRPGLGAGSRRARGRRGVCLFDLVRGEDGNEDDDDFVPLCLVECGDD